MPNILELVKFNADGLIPAVAQDIRTDEVLMLAYMNEESLRKTIETGRAHYYSRSRQKLWLKGETSGHFQQIRSISLDCDGDTLLLKVEQTGAACHTGHRSCFFTRLDADELKSGVGIRNSEEEVFPAMEAVTQKRFVETTDRSAAEPENMDIEKAAGPEVLGEVFQVISDRLINPKEGSYTNYLFGKGLDKILKKIGEEACEVVVASKNGVPGEISAEIADLIYHVMVLLVERGMSMEDVYGELNHRK